MSTHPTRLFSLTGERRFPRRLVAHREVRGLETRLAGGQRLEGGRDETAVGFASIGITATGLVVAAGALVLGVRQRRGSEALAAVAAAAGSAGTPTSSP